MKSLTLVLLGCLHASGSVKLMVLHVCMHVGIYVFLYLLLSAV